MYILTKNLIIYGVCEEKSYFKLQKNGYYIPCNFAQSTHILVDDVFYDGKEYRLLEVEEVPERLEMDGSWVYQELDIVVDEGLKVDILRKKRDILLAETDWAICLDSPLDSETKSEVMSYRQKLRDLPQQEGFPLEVEMPASPLLDEE